MFNHCNEINPVSLLCCVAKVVQPAPQFFLIPLPTLLTLPAILKTFLKQIIDCVKYSNSLSVDNSTDMMVTH